VNVVSGRTGCVRPHKVARFQGLRNLSRRYARGCAFRYTAFSRSLEVCV